MNDLELVEQKYKEILNDMEAAELYDSFEISEYLNFTVHRSDSSGVELTFYSGNVESSISVSYEDSITLANLIKLSVPRIIKRKKSPNFSVSECNQCVD